MALCREFMWWLRQQRGLDAVQAYQEEQARVLAAVERPALDPQLLALNRATASRPDALELGTAELVPSLTLWMSLSELIGNTHGLVLGGTGGGKTSLMAGLAVQAAQRDLEALRAGRRRAEEKRAQVWVLDHKRDLVVLVQRLLPTALLAMPREIAEAWLKNLVVIKPFGGVLVPLNILARDESVPPEVQAYDVTTLLNRLGGAPLGVHQDRWTFLIILLGILLGLTLPEIVYLLADTGRLMEVASRVDHPDVRTLASGGMRLSSLSLEGVRARFQKLVRLPAVARMLAGPGCISFRRMLCQNVLIDLGGAPLGCEDIGQFAAELFSLKMGRGIFERTDAEASKPTLIAVDEWAEAVGTSRESAERYGRLLTLARSRGIAFLLATQSLDLVSQANPYLPRVVTTNAAFNIAFRCAPADARALAPSLGVTGRRPRAAAAPWEAESRSPFLSQQEEQAQLADELTRLPQGSFWLWDRSRFPQPVRVRARRLAAVAELAEDSWLTRPLLEGAFALDTSPPVRLVRPRSNATGTRAAPAPHPLPPTRRPRSGR